MTIVVFGSFLIVPNNTVVVAWRVMNCLKRLESETRFDKSIDLKTVYNNPIINIDLNIQ